MTVSLVGRQAELRLMTSMLERLDAGFGGSVAVSGEAGIGKTTLLRAVCEVAASRGHRVFQASGAEPIRLVTFGVLPDALGAAADGQPAVLVLDDLHRADEGSIQSVAHLLRRRRSSPLLLLLGWRTGGASPQLMAALDAGRDTGLEHLELGPLSTTDAEELLTDVPEVDRHRWYTESGGNPFYLEQLARGAGMSRRSAEPSDGVAPSVPPALSAALAAETSGLSESAAGLLNAAAVLGDPFDLDLAAGVAELDARRALGALDELTAIQLVRDTDLPRQFKFRHPIVQRAIYGLSEESWTRAAHERAAHILAALGAPVTARAPHVERCAPAGDLDAVAMLTEAGNAAAEHSPETAVRWYGAALRLLSRDADSGSRVELLLAMASTLAATGRSGESLARLTEAVELVGLSDVRIRGKLLVLMARAHVLLAEPVAANRLLREALNAEASERSPEVVRLMIEVGVAHWRTREWNDMLRWAEAARDAAGELGDEPLCARARALQILASYLGGDVATARRWIAELSAVVDGLSDEALTDHLETLLYLGQCEAGVDLLDDAASHLERGIMIARATGQAYLFVPLLVDLAVTRLRQGRIAEAIELADLAVDRAVGLGNDQFQVWALGVSCWALWSRGDTAAAVAAGRRSYISSARAPAALQGWVPHLLRGGYHIETGEPRRGLEEILDHCGGGDLEKVSPTFKAFAYEFMVIGSLALGEDDRAAEWAARCEEIAADHGLASRYGYALRTRASVLRAHGEDGRAAELALVSAQKFRDAGYRIESARARLAAGIALSAHDPARAIVELERSHAELEAFGATGDRDEARRQLRRLGRPIRRDTEPGSLALAALTDRQRQIAELIADGCTNRVIGRRLFLSEKTIERHVSRIFAQLGVSSRAVLARAVASERELQDAYHMLSAGPPDLMTAPRLS